jgi:hypothetical protein
MEDTVYIVVLIVLFHLFGPRRVSVSCPSSEGSSGMGVDVLLVVEMMRGMVMIEGGVVQNDLGYGIGGVMEK